MVLPNGVHLLHPVPFYGNESDPQAFIDTQVRLPNACVVARICPDACVAHSSWTSCGRSTPALES
eukprot:3137239-Rhodomonas_salina.1